MKRELENALREGGEKVTQGKIRIDTTRALQRLRDFRFSDPAHWVLEVLRAAADSHAKTVTVTTDSDDVVIEFDGEPFPAAVMDHLLERALEPGETKDEARARLLALGMAGALGVGAKFLEVESGQRIVTLTADSVDVTDRPRMRGTRVHLRKAFGWRVVAGFVSGAPESRAIHEHARRYPSKLTVNGVEVKPRADKVKALVTANQSDKRFELETSFDPREPSTRSVLHIDVSGVHVATRQLKLDGLPLEATLSSRELRRNASGSDVVDDDELFVQALAMMRKRSLTLLDEWIEQLSEDPVWRQYFVARLLEEDLDPQLKKRLMKARVLPAPAGELLSPELVAERFKKNGRVLFATRAWAKDSYPEGTVLLDAEHQHLEKLLPEGKRLDVEKQVLSRLRIVEKRAELDSRQVVEARLSERHWNVTGVVKGNHLVGEVGVGPMVRGAFVQVLNHGRPIVSGELVGLTPLRLRAIVDVQKNLPDSFFEEGGDERLLAMVRDAVEAAAVEAICASLEVDDRPPVAFKPTAPRADDHALAFDLLQRMAQRNTKRSDIDPRLRATRLFSCVGDQKVSLDTLDTWDRWPWVASQRAHPLLSGEAVLVLDPHDLELLKRLGGKRLEDVSHQLDFELALRRRMERGGEPVEVIEHTIVRVKVREGNIQGEVALPSSGSNWLQIAVSKNRLRLETTQMSARFHGAAAAIDSSELTPNSRWTAFLRDEAWQRVIQTVQRAERLLVVPLVELPREKWGPAGHAFFEAFLSKGFEGFDPAGFDDVQRAVAAAKLFDANDRRVSLLELHAQPTLLSHVGRSRPEVPPDVLVVFEPPQMLAAISNALRRGFEDAGPELERASARRRLLALPEQTFRLPSPLPLTVSITGSSWNGLAGFRSDVLAEAKVHVRVEGRSWKSVSRPCSLPLTLVMEMPRLELTPNLAPADLRTVDDALREACHAVTREALKNLSAEDAAGLAARQVVLLALGRSLDDSLPDGEAGALRAVPVFPCTDGVQRSYEQLRGEAVSFVNSAMSGGLPDGRPIVVAETGIVRLALSRWSRRDDVESALRLQLNALRERQSIPQVTEVLAKAESPFRRKVSHKGLVGEVVVAPQHAGRLQLLLDRRPVVTLRDAVPAPLSAAIDSPRLRPTPGFKDVERDAAFDEVVELVKATGEKLAEQLATEPVPPDWESAFVQLAFAIVERNAWALKAKKSKSKAKKKKKAAQNDSTEWHPLLRKPLLRSNDGSLFSVRDLVELHRDSTVVAVVSRGGTFLEPKLAWWPRSAAEQTWASVLGLTFTDVTRELELADRQRARPRYATIDAPLESPWRARLAGIGIEGEVALPKAPEGQLVVEVLYDRRLLERWVGPHALGGVARVDSTAITPERDFSSARRDAHFKSVLAATEAALERAAAERIKQGGAAPELDAWLVAALRWRHGHHGAVGTQLSALALFTTLTGARITVAEVVALAATRGKVAVADPDVASMVGSSVVLVNDETTLAALAALELKHDDVTEELRRERELQTALTQRRLTSLQWNGESYARRKLAGPLGGELAISPQKGTLLLARDGIPVQALEHAWPAVVGVVDVPDLAVNATWTKATPTRAQVSLIAQHVDQLFVDLVDSVPERNDATREQVVSTALAYLVGETGGKVVLDSLEGACRVIARAPLFRTTDGLLVSLEQLLSAVAAWGRVAVFELGFGLPKREGQVVLVTSSFDAPWLDGLSTALGKSRLWKVQHRSEWDAVMREADPPPDTPLAAGLEALRREVRLLRAGALGHLTPDDLEDVKLSRSGGKTSLTYDAKRKLVMLDPDHPHIGKTLTGLDARPERLWVLLAAIFGVVNRALGHVTDEHEAKLALSLAAHLAANPKLLSPRNDKPSSA